jgi:hypothetical protein
VLLGARSGRWGNSVLVLQDTFGSHSDTLTGCHKHKQVSITCTVLTGCCIGSSCLIDSRLIVTACNIRRRYRLCQLLRTSGSWCFGSTVVSNGHFRDKSSHYDT